MVNKYSYENIEMWERAERLINNEVYICQSSLVEKLLNNGFFNIDDIYNQFKPCDTNNIENIEPQEIYEWYAISERLAEDLKSLDYPVLENEYGYWMGRTTTGQSMLLDSIIYEVLDLIDKRVLEITKEVSE